MKLSEKKQLIRLARDSIESEFSHEKLDISVSLQKILTKKRGVFVTLTKDRKLRGCIGFPEPIFPLGIALIKAAKSAAFEDPRFLPLSESELKEIKIEITILTKPEKTDSKKIKVGRDGLIIRKGAHSGLLLPQVAAEYKWDAKTFLEQTCYKAGLDKNAWKDAEVYSFQGKVIKE